MSNIKTKIYKPNSKLNELENKYKIVIWKNGINGAVKFASTKKQALEVERRLKRQFQ